MLHRVVITTDLGKHAASIMITFRREHGGAAGDISPEMRPSSSWSFFFTTVVERSGVSRSLCLERTISNIWMNGIWIERMLVMLRTKLQGDRKKGRATVIHSVHLLPVTVDWDKIGILQIAHYRRVRDTKKFVANWFSWVMWISDA